MTTKIPLHILSSEDEYCFFLSSLESQNNKTIDHVILKNDGTLIIFWNEQL